MANPPPVSGSREKKRVERLAGGLPSVQQARRDRGRRQWLPPRFWLWAVLFIGAGIIVWWRIEEGRIQRSRNELLAKQRAIVAELGPRWYSLRERVERWTGECGAAKFDSVVAPEAGKAWDFRSKPGIYLRLSQEASHSPKTIREAANKSLHDGFTSCLLLVANKQPTAGPRCETTEECPPGQLCNDFRHCAEHSQPFNLRIAYKAMYVMSEEWVAQIQEISNNLTVRGAAATFEAANRYDMPVASNLLERAEYFMVVVDEPADHADEADAERALAEDVDAGMSDDRSIPTGPHKARVCVWRLNDDKRMLAVVADASGSLVGGPAETSARTRIAMQRQANSCSLALSVREAMGVASGAEVPGDKPATADDKPPSPDDKPPAPDDKPAAPDDKPAPAGSADKQVPADK